MHLVLSVENQRRGFYRASGFTCPDQLFARELAGSEHQPLRSLRSVVVEAKARIEGDTDQLDSMIGLAQRVELQEYPLLRRVQAELAHHLLHNDGGADLLGDVAARQLPAPAPGKEAEVIDL